MFQSITSAIHSSLNDCGSRLSESDVDSWAVRVSLIEVGVCPFTALPEGHFRLHVPIHHLIHDMRACCVRRSWRIPSPSRAAIARAIVNARAATALCNCCAVPLVGGTSAAATSVRPIHPKWTAVSQCSPARVVASVVPAGFWAYDPPR